AADALAAAASPAQLHSGMKTGDALRVACGVVRRGFPGGPAGAGELLLRFLGCLLLLRGCLLFRFLGCLLLLRGCLLLGLLGCLLLRGCLLLGLLLGGLLCCLLLRRLL